MTENIPDEVIETILDIPAVESVESGVQGVTVTFEKDGEISQALGVVHALEDNDFKTIIPDQRHGSNPRLFVHPPDG